MQANSSLPDPEFPRRASEVVKLLQAIVNALDHKPSEICMPRLQKTLQFVGYEFAMELRTVWRGGADNWREFNHHIEHALWFVGQVCNDFSCGQQPIAAHLRSAARYMNQMIANHHGDDPCADLY